MIRDTRLLVVLVFAALMSAVTSSLGMLLVPTVAEQLNVSLSRAQWILTVNLLAGAVATPIMGRLSDGSRKQRLLIISLLVITVGSVVAATATNFPIFLIGRAMQGLAYGIVPVTIALARQTLSTQKVQPAISTLSVTVSAGLGLGYPLTGLFADTLGFRWAFGFGAVFALGAATLVWLTLPTDKYRTGPQRRFDLIGAMLLSFGMTGLLLTLSEGPQWGMLRLPTLVVAAAALCFLVSWAIHQLKVKFPLVNIRVFRRNDVLMANVTALGVGASMYIALSIVSIIAQAPTTTSYGLGLPLLLAGVVMLPLSLGSLGANRALRFMKRRNATPVILILGVSIVAAATWQLFFFHATLLQVSLGMFVFGIGVGMTFAAMPTLIHRSVAIAGLGSAVSFNQVLRTIGGSVGSAISGAMLAKATFTTDFPTSGGVQSALLVSAIGCTAMMTLLIVNRFLATRQGK